MVKVVPAPRLVCVELNPGPRGRRVGANLTVEQKWEIVIYSTRLKLSPSEIARKVPATRKSVYAVLEKYNRTGTVDDYSGRGRPPALTAAEVKRVIKKARKKRKAPQIARELKKCSIRTIQRILKKNKFFYGKVKKVQKLYQRHKDMRVEHAKKMLHYDHKPVLFSDEKTFELGGGQEYCWQEVGHRAVKEYVKHAPKLHIWGAVGYYVKTPFMHKS